MFDAIEQIPYRRTVFAVFVLRRPPGSPLLLEGRCAPRSVGAARARGVGGGSGGPGAARGARVGWTRGGGLSSPGAERAAASERSPARARR